jgi:hypothetical protein
MRSMGHLLRISIVATAILTGAMTISGCKSDWVEVTIENQTGKPVHEFVVDYPSASFGTNTLAPGAPFHYRFQIRGAGPVRVEFTGEDGKISHAQGPALSEHQQGQLIIRLLPQNKVEFLPSLQPAS